VEPAATAAKGIDRTLLKHVDSKKVRTVNAMQPIILLLSLHINKNICLSFVIGEYIFKRWII
jgi:hypothetical protein